MQRPALTLLLGTIVLAFIGPAVRADPIASDTFESYTPGTQLNGQNGGSGVAGPYAVDATPGANVTATSQVLTYTNGAVTSDGGGVSVQIADAANSNQTISRPFPSQSTAP